jgi:hypothetical protein
MSNRPELYHNKIAKSIKTATHDNEITCFNDDTDKLYELKKDNVCQSME